MLEQHPAVTESLKRLAKLERRSPPGYPLGYKLQRHHYLCTGCGRKTDFEILLTVRRTGGNGKGYAPTAQKEVVYDLPVDTTDTSFVTPRCGGCIEWPRVAVPALPVGKAIIGKHPDTELNLDELFEEIDLEALGIL